MRRFAKSDKVGDLLRHGISNALLQELNDARLRWISVTEVQVNRDLSVARVYYTVVEPNLDRKSAAEALSENLRPLKSYLSSRLHLRQLPEIRFAFDETAESARRIEDLLASLHRANAEGGRDAD